MKRKIMPNEGNGEHQESVRYENRGGLGCHGPGGQSGEASLYRAVRERWRCRWSAQRPGSPWRPRVDEPPSYRRPQGCDQAATAGSSIVPKAENIRDGRKGVWNMAMDCLEAAPQAEGIKPEPSNEQGQQLARPICALELPRGPSDHGRLVAAAQPDCQVELVPGRQPEDKVIDEFQKARGLRHR